MPRYKVSYKLYDEEAKEFFEFCREVGLAPERAAKQALFYAINDARRRAEEMQLAQMEAAARVTPDDTSNSRDPSSNSTEGMSVGQGSDSTLPTDKTNDATDTRTV